MNGEFEEYRSLYIEEAEELLQLLNQNLIALEKDSENKESINEIFRAAHTLKSMSASMGYTVIAELAHSAEDLLVKIKEKSEMVTSGTVDVLFEAFDQLEAWVKCVKTNEPLPESIDSDIVDRLRGSAGAKITEKPVEKKDSQGFELTKEQQDAAGSFLNREIPVYELSVDTKKDCLLKSARMAVVMQELKKMGEIIKSIPDEEHILKSDIPGAVNVLFASQTQQDKILEALKNIADIEYVNIKTFILNPPKQGPAQADKTESKKQESDLGAVSTLSTVKIKTQQLDLLMNLVEELTISKMKISQHCAYLNNRQINEDLDSLERVIQQLQNEAVKLRLIPVRNVFNTFPKIVRNLVKRQKKQINFEVIGGEIELDRMLLESLTEPLIHMLRNSIDHGIELPEERIEKNKPAQGKIVLRAYRRQQDVFIEIEDDGRGMDLESIKQKAIANNLLDEQKAENMSPEEIYMLTTQAGLSTAKEVTSVSGRGIGLDVVKALSERFGGNLFIETQKDKGCKIILRFPPSTAIIQALFVQSAEKIFAIPIAAITEISNINVSDIKIVDREEVIILRDKIIPLVRLDDLLEMRSSESEQIIMDDKKSAESATLVKPAVKQIAIVEYADKYVGIIIDKILDKQNIVVKPLGPEFKRIKGFLGATILGDGKIILVLDALSLVV